MFCDVSWPGDARRIAEQSGTQQDLAASKKRKSQKKRKAANGRSGKQSRSTDH